MCVWVREREQNATKTTRALSMPCKQQHYTAYDFTVCRVLIVLSRFQQTPKLFCCKKREKEISFHSLRWISVRLYFWCSPSDCQRCVWIHWKLFNVWVCASTAMTAVEAKALLTFHARGRRKQKNGMRCHVLATVDYTHIPILQNEIKQKKRPTFIALFTRSL